MDHAKRIYEELLIEVGCLWYISDQFGKKIMLKAPSTILNAIVKGFPVEFLFGIDDQHVFPVFHNGIRIYDDPVHFTKISGTHRFAFEHKSLRDIMVDCGATIELYNELNIPFASSRVTFNFEDCKSVLKLQGNIDELYHGAFNTITAKSLDCFDFTFDPSRNKPHIYELRNIVLKGHFLNWQIAQNLIIGYNGNNEFGTVANEGEILEKQILAPLEHLFHNNIFRNSKISDKYGYRELTDIFAFHDYGVFLIESKALAIKDDSQNRTMERKIKGLQKQVEKAIDQLKGAAKKIAQNTTVFDAQGN